MVCFSPSCVCSHARATLRESSGIYTAEMAKPERKPELSPLRTGRVRENKPHIRVPSHPKVGVASRHARPQDPLTSPFPAIVPPASTSENFALDAHPVRRGGWPYVEGASARGAFFSPFSSVLVSGCSGNGACVDGRGEGACLEGSWGSELGNCDIVVCTRDGLAYGVLLI